MRTFRVSKLITKVRSRDIEFHNCISLTAVFLLARSFHFDIKGAERIDDKEFSDRLAALKSPEQAVALCTIY